VYILVHYYLEMAKGVALTVSFCAALYAVIKDT